MVESIIDKIESKFAGDNVPRQYLGLSEIGHHCPRYLWYAYHNQPAAPTEGRILRLFRLGNTVEENIVADLTSIGFDVTRRQEEVEITSDNITLRGHIDGIVDGKLLEIKSTNEKSFNALIKVASYEKWKPKYKAQVHSYMVLLGLSQCLAIVENKNDSRLYTEIINLDMDYVTKLFVDVFAAIQSREIPCRTCPDVSWYLAKWCDRSKICFGK